MRSRAANQARSHDTVLGRTSPGRAGSRGITFRDGTTEAHPVVDLIVVGGTITDNDDGTAVLTIGDDGGDPTSGNYVLKFRGGIEWVKTIAISGSTRELDLEDGNDFDVTLSTNCTITTTGWTNGYLCTIVVDLDLAGFTPTFTGVWWLDASTGIPTTTPPSFPTGATAKARVVLSSRDGGTTVWAHLVGSGSSSAAAIAGLGFTTQILLADGHATPFTFNDLLQMDDGSSFMYADP